jgi:hypothetical protein
MRGDTPLPVRVALALDVPRTVVAVAVELEVRVAEVREALDDLCSDGIVRPIPYSRRFERVAVPVAEPERVDA